MVCTTLNYIEQSLILAFTITPCISVFAFPPSIAIPIWIASSEIGLNICTIVAEIKKCNGKKKKSIRKKKKKNGETVLLTKYKIKWHRSLNL